MLIDKAACDFQVAVLTRNTTEQIEEAVNAWLDEGGPIVVHSIEFYTNLLHSLHYTAVIVHQRQDE
jgi:hypothetical protein